MSSGTAPPTVSAMYSFPSCMSVMGVPMAPDGRSSEPTIALSASAHQVQVRWMRRSAESVSLEARQW